MPGTHKTVQGAQVNVTGSGDALKVNDAGLVCGGVRTANATVYMIDTVLTPPQELTAAERTARTRNPYAYGRFPSQDSARRPAAISGATASSTRLPDAPAPASWSRKATPAAMIASLKYASAM